jgi:hypothetical protein
MSIKVQIDDIVRDAKSEEIAIIETQRVETEAMLVAKETRETVRHSAKAKLAALGLTEDEVNAIIGGAQ